MNAFAYLRISEDRHGDSVSPEQQRHEILELAARKGYQITQWFEDRDLSAYRKHIKRPAWEAMLTRVGEVDAIIVWELERASRRLVVGATLLEHLDDHNCRLLTVRAALDSVENRDAVEVLMAVSAGESRRLAARIARSHRYRTTVLGEASHPRDRYGFRYDRDTRTFTVHAEEAAVIRAMVAASLKGHGDVPIARALNDGTLVGVPVAPMRAEQWSAVSVKHLLESPALAGFAVHHGKPATEEPTLPAIISVEEWRWLQHVRARRRSRKIRDRTGEPTLLKGLVRCASCGAQMYRGSPPPNQVYACSAGNRGLVCPARASINAAWLDDKVRTWFKDELRAKDERTRPDAPDDETALAVRGEIAARKRSLSRLLDSVVRDAVPQDVFEAKAQELRDELQLWEYKLAHVERPRPAFHYPSVLEVFDDLDVVDQRELLTAVIDRIEVKPRTAWRQPPSDAQFEIFDRWPRT